MPRNPAGAPFSARPTRAREALRRSRRIEDNYDVGQKCASFLRRRASLQIELIVSLLNGRWSVVGRSDWPIDVQQHLSKQALGKFGPAFARIFRNPFEGAIHSGSTQLITDERSLQTAASFPARMIGHKNFLSWSASMGHAEAFNLILQIRIPDGLPALE